MDRANTVASSHQ